MLTRLIWIPFAVALAADASNFGNVGDSAELVQTEVLKVMNEQLDDKPFSEDTRVQQLRDQYHAGHMDLHHYLTQLHELHRLVDKESGMDEENAASTHHEQRKKTKANKHKHKKRQSQISEEANDQHEDQEAMEELKQVRRSEATYSHSMPDEPSETDQVEGTTQDQATEANQVEEKNEAANEPSMANQAAELKREENWQKDEAPKATEDQAESKQSLDSSANEKDAEMDWHMKMWQATQDQAVDAKQVKETDDQSEANQAALRKLDEEETEEAETATEDMAQSNQVDKADATTWLLEDGGVLFEPGPMGVNVMPDTGFINTVSDGQQAATKGVKPGWQIRSIDHEPYSRDLLVSKVKGTANYRLDFDRKREGQSAANALISKKVRVTRSKKARKRGGSRR